MSKILPAFLLALVAMTASAQPPAPKSALPTENVTVTDTRSRKVLQDFVDSFAAHGRLTGQITRWESGICPITTGLPAEGADFVTARLKEIAAKVGAPVSKVKNCKHNIEIVFTRTPQALLDNVKAHYEVFLGYHETREERDRLVAVTHPIQAWYTTATQDLNGAIQMDASTTTDSSRGLKLELPCEMLSTGSGPAGGICTEFLPGIKKYNVRGSRLDDGLRSDFYNIIIVADISKIASLQLDSVSDYIAMLALAQPASLDDCPSLASILSLLAKDCESRAGRMTGADLGYLQGAYKMNPEMALGLQQRQITNQMMQALPEN